ncbi:hypothetical protein QBC34DRAFT_132008 [Podospora aff. communis PSN243]|uniref:Dihydrodipicolinate synthase n=1 Tax=Podospora aff. communis PSN243 TaxID=3040156 RepID=A0AAV9GIW5_9PEZI|nr:hypothetical protein QBC34DRAFT_132008 [Podospora aff. communis PSN243]
MATPIPPKGVFVPSPTFFLPLSSSSSSPTPYQPTVDVPTQVAHSVFLARAGITGIVLLGSTGEAIHLSSSERIDLVSSVRKGLDDAGFPEYPLMAGVLTSGGIEETLQWLREYADAGAQWGLVLAPGYFGAGVGQEGLREWYEAVADRSPIPILVYNYPGVTNGVVVLPETYTVLARHEKIVGCKMSHGNVSHHVQVSLDPEIDHEQFRVYSGFGQQLGPIVQFGAAGVIDGLAAFFPRTVVRLFSLVEAGSQDTESKKEALRLQYVVSRAEEFIVRYGILGIREGVYRAAGFGNQEGGRLPLRGRLTEADWEKGSKLFLKAIEATEAKLKG